METKLLENYILQHIEPEDEVLKELNRETHLKVLGARMLSGHLQGQFLTLISKIIRPQHVLEIGTFTGYSAICLARGLAKGGRLITVEIDDELESIAAKYFEKAGFKGNITQLIGPAVELIPQFKDMFDLVFLDGDKREYVTYYELVFEKLRPGGIIIADNTLWSSKVLESPDPDDEQTRGIIAFNKLVKNDNRVEEVILPMRDGITLIRKK